MTSIDLSDAYLHIPIHPDFRKYLRICVDGKVLQFSSLCCGRNAAPTVFTKMLTPVATHLKAQGVKLHCYLNDWFVKASDPKQTLRDTQTVVNLMTKLG